MNWFISIMFNNLQKFEIPSIGFVSMVTKDKHSSSIYEYIGESARGSSVLSLLIR